MALHVDAVLGDVGDEPAEESSGGTHPGDVEEVLVLERDRADETMRAVEQRERDRPRARPAPSSRRAAARHLARAPTARTDDDRTQADRGREEQPPPRAPVERRVERWERDAHVRPEHVGRWTRSCDDEQPGPRAPTQRPHAPSGDPVRPAARGDATGVRSTSGCTEPMADPVHRTRHPGPRARRRAPDARRDPPRARRSRARFPACSPSIPAGWNPIVVDNGSIDGSADVARGPRRGRGHEPRRGFGAACFAGLVAATADVVAFMDCDGSLDGARSRPRRRTRRRRSRRPGARRAGCRTAGAWPWHLRVANRDLARAVRRRTGVVISTTSGRCASPRRAAARSRSASATVASAGRSRWCCGPRTPAGASRRSRSTYRPRVGRSKVTGTVRGVARTVHDMRVALR